MNRIEVFPFSSTVARVCFVVGWLFIRRDSVGPSSRSPPRFDSFSSFGVDHGDTGPVQLIIPYGSDIGGDVMSMNESIGEEVMSYRYTW